MQSGAHNESERGKKTGARRDTPTHLIKNRTSTHDASHVSKDRFQCDSHGTHMYSFALDGTQLAVKGFEVSSSFLHPR